MSPVYLPSDVRFEMASKGCSKEQIKEARQIALQMMKDRGDLSPLTINVLG